MTTYQAIRQLAYTRHIVCSDCHESGIKCKHCETRAAFEMGIDALTDRMKGGMKGD